MNTAIDALKAGEAALRSGNAGRARELFVQATQYTSTQGAALLGLSYACRALGDDESMMTAIDRLLMLEPRNVRALILKGDSLSKRGEARSASSYYLMALKSAPPPEQLRPELLAELRRARDACERMSNQYQTYIVDRLQANGFDPARSSRRFSQSLDIVLGKKRIYLQEPKYYYFPELPQIQFYDRAGFPWLDEVERASDDIRTELLEVMKEPAAFAPYVQGDANRPRKEQAGMLDNPAWSAFYLWKNGEPVAGSVERCPKTMHALRNAPLARVPNRSPSILFSLLQPGAKIPPHNGLVNTRLICHLPLIVPGQCGFRVGNEVREWAQGSAWLFDDTIEHEAWNNSKETRVILLFDVWRPELSEQERGLVTSLFEAIDAHDGKKPDWEI